ncbi:MAG: OmpA family protein [Candidatus Marinimicrobia bacterium]|nr:OmpA family protein [Candidatus Neomarinimicrobiota bacterium]
MGIVGLVLLAVSGCVTTGKFRAKEDEARRYQSEVAELARQHQATLGELGSTATQLEDQTAARTVLERDTTRLASTIASLQANNADLAATLRASNTEKDVLIAAMTQARQQQDAVIGDLRQELSEAAAEIEQLEADLEDLGKQSRSTLAEVDANYQDLVAGLQNEISDGEIIITSLKDKLTVNIVDQVLFLSGQASVKDDGKRVLATLAGVLKEISAKQIQIIGHTDNVPIGRRLRALYPSNWELSAARATHVARYMIDELDLDPRHFSVAGFGEFRPVATNTTDAGRQRNRRIEIILLPYEEPPFLEVPPSAAADSAATADSLLTPIDSTQASDSTSVE